MLVQSTEYFQLPNLARCHRAAFLQSLATALGERYFTRMLSWYLSSSRTFLFHVKDYNECIAVTVVVSSVMELCLPDQPVEWRSIFFMRLYGPLHPPPGYYGILRSEQNGHC